VTNAQFDAFVTAGGYDEPRYWPEAEAAGIWQDGSVVMSRDELPRCRPMDPGEPYNLSNHPVVNVSWYEALAFCRWLSERLTICGSRLMIHNLTARSEVKKQEWLVRLPTEAEWEKAARGPSAGSECARIFPWGNEVDPERANYADTGIGATSAVGCFPAGASPYGLFDMSGNVEEWCQTVWPDNYDGYVQKVSQSTAAEGPRVLRGGAFGYDARVIRCACRYRYAPGNWNHDVGFRVCLAPARL
jgi:formylglycine-generating enzyme required for sulfatase activity